MYLIIFIFKSNLGNQMWITNISIDILSGLKRFTQCAVSTFQKKCILRIFFLSYTGALGGLDYVIFI